MLIQQIHFRVVFSVVCWSLIHADDIITFDGRVLAGLSNSVRLKEVDGHKRNSKKACNQNKYFQTFLSIVNVIVVSVLPNDVGGLCSFDELERFFQELGLHI